MVSCVVGLLSLPLILAGCNTVEGAAKDLRTPFEPQAPSPPPVSFVTEPEIRVRVMKGIGKVKIEAPRGVVLRALSGGRSETYVSPVRIEMGANGSKVTDGRGVVRMWPFGADLEALAADAGGGIVAPRLNESMKIEGVRYPGFAQVRARWSDAPGQFDVVLVMPVESYLPGVVTGEMPRDWPRQAFAAQAVAARTYALHERQRARMENRTYDVEANTNDQVYSAGSSSTAVLEAVSLTRGQAVTWRGGLLRAYFSSTCGGRPSSAAEVWPTGAGYEFNLAEPLQGKPRSAPCQDSKYYRWQAERSSDELGQRLRQWARGARHEAATIGRIRTIEVSDRNEAQRPTVYKVTDSAGATYSFKAEELRMASNQGAPGLSPITDKNRVWSGDFEAEVWATRVRFRGRGWGHGVGMCQYCARQFAHDGLDWRTMVQSFYPGAEIRKLY